MKKSRTVFFIFGFFFLKVKIINNASLVISMPFSSPAFIANQMNIKSIFYDPSENISINDRGAQGLPLIQGKKMLDNYIQNISNEF